MIVKKRILQTQHSFESGVTCEPDPRHIELRLEHVGLDGTRSRASAPDHESETEYDETATNDALECRFVAFALCSNQFARDMTKPTISDRSRMKRAARYLKMHVRWVKEFRVQEPTSLIHIFTDTN